MILDGKSQNTLHDQVAKLKEAFPEIVSENGIDWEKLKLTLGDDIALTNERYVLNWAGKSEAFRAIQTPTTATLKPQRDQSVDFDTTQNIFIEGENLEVLKVLQKSYYGKVKMIYIDPPYNTGNDSFIYPDKFSESKEEYLKRIGDKDEAGYLTKEGFFRKNSKENGQFHSNWLSMIYPRLFLARNLLRDDGVIYVSIDDNEVHNLRMVMNEVFGEENFVACIVWKNVYGGGSKSKHVVNQHEYSLMFAKHRELVGEIDLPPDPDARKRYTERDDKFESRGPYFTQPLATTSMDSRPNLRYPILWQGEEVWPEKQWQWSKDRVENALKKDELVLRKENGKWSVRYKQYLRDEEGIERPSKLFSVLSGPWTQEGTEEIKGLFGDPKTFPFPKPSSFIKHLLSACWRDRQAIILDFFAGSGATSQAVYELNKEDGGTRRFILAQLPEKVEETPEYATIAEICKERIRRMGKMVKEEIESERDLFKGRPLDLGFRVFTLEPSTFKIWRTDIIETEEELKKQMEAFVDPVRVRSEADDMAWEILLKSGFELTTPLEKMEIGGVPVHSIAGGEVMLLLEAISQKAIDAIVGRVSDPTGRDGSKPKHVICLDRLFAGNDQLKTNTVLQMKDAGVEFRTI